jgi:hypothetical protein
VSIKELDMLLSLLAEKKRKMEQEEAERNMQILLTFLNRLREQKVNELNEVCCLQSGPSIYSLVILILPCNFCYLFLSYFSGVFLKHVLFFVRTIAL